MVNQSLRVDRVAVIAGARDQSSSVVGALSGLSLCVLLSSLGTSIANVSLPTLAQTFHAPFQRIQWVILAYLLAVTALVVGAGRLADILGHRRMLLTGLLMFTLASAACGLAQTLDFLIASRVLQGVGAALLIALPLALVVQVAPKAKGGRAMGLLGGMSALGTALGPSLGGLLLSAFGWQAIFLVNVPIALVAACLVYRYLPDDSVEANPARERIDSLGLLLLALTLVAYALAMTLGRGHFGLLNLGLLMGALVGGWVFARLESRVSSPLIRLSMLREGKLSRGLGMSGLVSTVMMTSLVVGPFYLSRALGLKDTAVGLALSVGPLSAAMMGAVAGRMVDAWGIRLTTHFGLTAMALAAATLSVVPTTLGLPGYLGPMLLMTTGYALFQTSNNTSVMGNLPSDQRGLVSGLLNLSRNLGLITGASFMGLVFARVSGGSDITSAGADQVAAETRAAFGVAAVLVLVTLAVALYADEDAGRPSVGRPGH